MKTVTLETARRLKDAGYSDIHSCYVYWLTDPHPRLVQLPSNCFPRIPAPTTGELLEWFDDLVHTPYEGNDIVFVSIGTMGGLRVAEVTTSGLASFTDDCTHPDNPAEALGLLAIKILESQQVIA